MSVRRSTVLVALAAALIAAPGASAAPGDLDAGFASAGIYEGQFSTVFPGAEDSQTVATDSQDRTYLSASVTTTLNGQSASVNVQRLTPAGALDTTFAGTGTVSIPVSGTNRNVGVVVDAQDRPVIALSNGTGGLGTQIGLVRLTQAGALDPTFGTAGTVVTALPGSAAGYGVDPQGVGIDASGRVLVAGDLVDANVGAKATTFVARFTAAGALDSTYGTGGFYQGTVGPLTSAIHVLADGTSFTAGYDYDRLEVIKLTAGGVLDAGFGGGIAYSRFGTTAGDQHSLSVYGITVDASGRPIVTAQFNKQNENARLGVARFTTAGDPDPSFGNGTPAAGVTLLAAPAIARGIDAAVQCDGKILVASNGSFPGPNLARNVIGLSRFASDGSLDTTFAGSGPSPGTAQLVVGNYDSPGDLTLVPGAAVISGFRRDAAGPGPINDRPIVARVVANDGCPATPAPTGTTPVATTPEPATPAPADVTIPATSSVPVPFSAPTVPATQAPLAAATPKPVACVAGKLILTDVFPLAGRTQFLGVAGVPSAGKKVAIVSTWNGKTVATLTVAADGSFAGTAPLPPSKIRLTSEARYQAIVGGHKSQQLKFARRMYTTGITASGQSLTITGATVKPLATKPAPILVRASASCSSIAKGAIVASVQPSASGAFTATFPLPADLRSGTSVYVRAETKVPKTVSGKTTFTTYTLTRGIKLGS